MFSVSVLVMVGTCGATQRRRRGGRIGPTVILFASSLGAGYGGGGSQRDPLLDPSRRPIGQQRRLYDRRGRSPCSPEAFGGSPRDGDIINSLLRRLQRCLGRGLVSRSIRESAARIVAKAITGGGRNGIIEGVMMAVVKRWRILLVF